MMGLSSLKKSVDNTNNDFAWLAQGPEKTLKVLAEWTGLEPATLGVTGRYSNQLNYHSAHFFGGCCRDRTCDPRLVRAMLSQLS